MNLLRHSVPNLIALAFCILEFESCSFNREITISNQYPSPISLHTQLAFQGIEVHSQIEPLEQKVFSSSSFAVSGPDDEAELRAVAVFSDGGEPLGIFRVSASLLKARDWTLTLPWTITDSLQHLNLDPVKFAEWLGYKRTYFYAQDLYNAGRFSDCCNVIKAQSRSVMLNAGIRLSYRKLGGAQDQEAFAILRGMVLLTYLSSYKAGYREEASGAWSLLSKLEPQYVEFLKEHDFEISRMQAQ